MTQIRGKLLASIASLVVFEICDNERIQPISC